MVRGDRTGVRRREEEENVSETEETLGRHEVSPFGSWSRTALRPQSLSVTDVRRGPGDQPHPLADAVNYLQRQLLGFEGRVDAVGGGRGTARSGGFV